MNIKMEHVSVEGLRVNDDISSLLDKYNIKNYLDLKKQIYSQNQEVCDNYFLQKAYRDFENKFNEQLDGVKIYSEYMNAVSMKNNLNITSYDIDKMVKVTDLPIFASSPNLVWSAVMGYYSKNKQIDMLDEYSVEFLKRKMMECYVVNGESVIKLIYSSNGIGEVKYNQLQASLMFYDKYVESLLEKYKEHENPFYYMYDEKLAMVQSKRLEIFNYLYGNGYEFVFGRIDNVVNAINSSRLSVTKKKLLAIERVIANYVTFDEAIDIASPKVLNKFIVPYGKR